MGFLCHCLVEFGDGGVKVDPAGPRVAAGGFGQGLQFFQSHFGVAHLQPKLGAAHGDGFAQQQAVVGQFVEIYVRDGRWLLVACCWLAMPDGQERPGEGLNEGLDGFYYFHAVSMTRGVGQRLYSLSGVVQRLGESFQGHSTTDGEQRRREKWPIFNPVVNLVRAPARIPKAARSTSLGQVFDRSSNPDSDTHTQVPTTHVSSIRLAPRVHN